jgi:hypothetical protein
MAMIGVSLILGIKVRLDRRVDRAHGCHDNLAIISEGRGPHAAQLHCIECGKHRGWLAHATANFLEEAVRFFGVPNEPFTIRDATATATAQKGTDPMATRNDLFPSKYLSAADLKGKSIVVTIDKVTQETLEANGKSQLKPIVHFVGAQKTLVLNVTNYNTIADQHGDETNGWSGCKIKLYPDVVDVKGKTTPCIRVSPNRIEEDPPAPKKPEPPTPSGGGMDDEIPF